MSYNNECTVNSKGFFTVIPLVLQCRMTRIGPNTAIVNNLRSNHVNLKPLDRKIKHTNFNHYMGFFVVLPRSEARKVPAKIPTKLQPRTDEDPTVR